MNTCLCDHIDGNNPIVLLFTPDFQPEPQFLEMTGSHDPNFVIHVLLLSP